jgi:hypothetical protein
MSTPVEAEQKKFARVNRFVVKSNFIRVQYERKVHCV